MNNRTMQDGQQQLCRNFTRYGSCPYGDHCWFSHDFPSTNPPSSDPSHELFLCPYVNTAKGCKYGNKCYFSHGNNDETNNEEHCCSICLETVHEQFGLMSGCDHCFCLGCLREWRYSKSSSEATKQCPVCRIPIEYVVPSTEFLTGPEKDELIQRHFDKLKNKPCRRFDGRIGSCPFGKECYYAHIGRDGEDMKPRDIAKKVYTNNQRRQDFLFMHRDLQIISRILHHHLLLSDELPFIRDLHDDSFFDDIHEIVDDDYDGEYDDYSEDNDFLDDDEYDDIYVDGAYVSGGSDQDYDIDGSLDDAGLGDDLENNEAWTW